jgi:uncharacterized protein YjiS (DUF1127 family)
MKQGYVHRETTDAGGGAARVPFNEFVAPIYYVGEAVAPLFTAVFNGVDRGINAINHWRWERATRHALASLDDRILDDIGVSRSEIPDVARAAASNRTFEPTRRSPWIV